MNLPLHSQGKKKKTHGGGLLLLLTGNNLVEVDSVTQMVQVHTADLEHYPNQLDISHVHLGKSP